MDPKCEFSKQIKLEVGLCTCYCCLASFLVIGDGKNSFHAEYYLPHISYNTDL